jgi:hypothetical protein
MKHFLLLLSSLKALLFGELLGISSAEAAASGFLPLTSLNGPDRRHLSLHKFIISVGTTSIKGSCSKASPREFLLQGYRAICPAPLGIVLLLPLALPSSQRRLYLCNLLPSFCVLHSELVKSLKLLL